MNLPLPALLAFLLLASGLRLPANATSVQPAAPRLLISLDGDWLFQRDQAHDWKTVLVPSSFQSHEGTSFHGIGWYKKAIAPFELPRGKRVLVQFQAAATQAEVWWDGQRLGTHLGGWTPFRFDVTDLVRTSPKHQSHELQVRLDELVGHNTQGFLPIITPHFGGLWQDVSLLVVPETYVDDLQLMAVGDPKTGALNLSVPLAGSAPDAIRRVSLRCRLRGEQGWTDLSPEIARSNNVLKLCARVANVRLWSPAEPNLYELEVSLPGAKGDRLQTRAAFRSLEAFGPELRLNGHPLVVRGLLNWGYSAPLNAPNPGEKVWRQELELARSRGFNLMKFCLWVPPHRYLELADEMGMLTWMEYPTWHPNFTGKYLEPLRKEFREFFLYDRNHPSVVLRSLTCETGPSAELGVLRSLYQEAHELVPGALVEDDSSWIGWNRIHDFYDDHPYGNNDTWVNTLEGFREYILGHGIKPLVLGESISADTWLDRAAWLEDCGQQRPWWAPAVLDDTGRWKARMRGLAGNDGLDELRPESLAYGMLMRKFQIETYRREIPYGGYVISVIRDIPKASMGLLDYLGRPKWSEADWAWQCDTMCLLKTEADRRSFASSARLKAEVLVSHFGLKALTAAELTTTLSLADLAGPALQQRSDKVEQNPGTLAMVATLDWRLPAVTTPTRVLLRADLKSDAGEFHNEWPLWIVPTNSNRQFDGVQVHSSVASELKRELFADCAPFRPDPVPDAATGAEPIVVAAHFDADLAQFLEQGGRVLLLPDGKTNSFALAAHWFLRGGPYIPTHALSRTIPREFFVELQHFDLSAPVVANLPQLDSFDPILMLWDTHDQDTVKTHGIIFETRVGRGRLLVSAARHTGAQNAAGHWLLGVLLDHLRAPEPPRNELTQAAFERLLASHTHP